VLTIDEFYHWRDRARQRVEKGDLDEYRKVCTYLFERWSKTANPEIASYVVDVCILGPEAIPDLQRVARLAEQSDARLTGGANLRTVGYSLYRAGQFKQALERLNAAGANDIMANLFRAMIHHRLGHAEEARKWLDKAVRTNDESFKQGHGRMHEFLQREAEALLKEGQP
jgi:tetratricopeptide (TPR) repeat protein